MSIKHITFDDSASLSYFSITGSYQTLLTLSDDADILWLANSTDALILFQVPSSTTTKIIQLLPGASKCIDARSNSKRVAKGLIKVCYSLAAPTAGYVEATAAR